jgi:hypothetical protein
VPPWLIGPFSCSHFREPVDPDDPRYRRLIKEEGRAALLKALKNPVARQREADGGTRQAGRLTMKYFYEITGSDADHETWQTGGEVEVNRGDFAAAANLAMIKSFGQLTQGRSSCRGPYSIAQLLIIAESGNK